MLRLSLSHYFLICTLTSLIALTLGQSDFECPPTSGPIPAGCSCTVDPADKLTGILTCSGTSVDQKSIDDLLTAIDQENGDREVLTFKSFSIENTKMTQINLEKLTTLTQSVDIEELIFRNNPYLTLVSDPNTATSKLMAKSVTIENTGLDSVHLLRLLGNINPTGGLHTLTLINNKVELLAPIIFQFFPTLKVLHFKDSHLSLQNGMFATSKVLKTIDLSNGNLDEVGPNVFRMSDQHSGDLEINLDGNQLTPNQIRPLFVPFEENLNTRYHISLRNNSLTTLYKIQFQALLTRGRIRSLDVSGNKFRCDFRMQWLRARKILFQNRVTGVNCVNDPGKDIFTTDLVSANFSCPAPSTIAPCGCTTGVTLVTQCNGPTVFPENVTRLLGAVRLANGQSSLDLNRFTLSATNLTTLDLSPLAGNKLGQFIVRNNSLLNSAADVVGPAAKFSVRQVVIENNEKLGVEAIGKILRAITVSNLTGPGTGEGAGTGDGGGGALRPAINNCILRSNNIKGPNEMGLPLLENFSPLFQNLDLSNNPIGALSRGAFLGGRNLRLITLSNANLTKIGDGTFNLNIGPRHPGPIRINLDNNKLTDSSFEPGFVPLGATGRLRFVLNLQNNSFEYISSINFESVLDPQGPVLRIEMDGNPFVCDNRMRWLKEGRKQFEGHVLGVNCQNDKGKTIFNTDKVTVSTDDENNQGSTFNSNNNLFGFFIILLPLSRALG